MHCNENPTASGDGRRPALRVRRVPVAPLSSIVPRLRQGMDALRVVA